MLDPHKKLLAQLETHINEMANFLENVVDADASAQAYAKLTELRWWAEAGINNDALMAAAEETDMVLVKHLYRDPVRKRRKDLTQEDLECGQIT